MNSRTDACENSVLLRSCDLVLRLQINGYVTPTDGRAGEKCGFLPGVIGGSFFPNNEAGLKKITKTALCHRRL